MDKDVPFYFGIKKRIHIYLDTPFCLFIYFPSLIMGNMKNNVERKKTATPLRVAA